MALNKCARESIAGLHVAKGAGSALSAKWNSLIFRASDMVSVLVLAFSIQWVFGDLLVFNGTRFAFRVLLSSSAYGASHGRLK